MQLIIIGHCKKTIFDYYYCEDKVNNELCSVSPRGRSKIWISGAGDMRIFTDKEIKNYFSKNEMTDLVHSVVSRRHKKNPGVTYHYSHNIDNLLNLVKGNVSEKCNQLIEVMKDVKIQYSHKIK